MTCKADEERIHATWKVRTAHQHRVYQLRVRLAAVLGGCAFLAAVIAPSPLPFLWH